MTPRDLIEPLVEQRAVFFHAGLVEENPGCDSTLGDFMHTY